MLAPTDDDVWVEYRVTPRYLAGSSGIGDPGIKPIIDLGGPCHEDGLGNLTVSSPDQRLKVGWFGDDYLLWKIAAYADGFSPPRWVATFNQNTPAEIVAGLTTALAQDYLDGNGRFLAGPSRHRADGFRPLIEAGWRRSASEPGTIAITAPDKQAGLLIDNRRYAPDDDVWTLWAGPPGWGTRAEGTFTTGTPTHLIAATAAAMADPAPLIRCRHQIPRECQGLVQLSPVIPPSPPVPTPLDVRRTAVAQALDRATRTQAAGRRALAAHTRTTLPHPAIKPDHPPTAPRPNRASPPSLPRPAPGR
ncbi:DUF317 domain-containing protein [Streptomyces hygroscopicus]|uniref:DUF317 domain-containing protein n=1 Tax=Streptomyces hygroscopicus TaxID=1912 RepID=UPI0007674621|nr:DUF317 domain-containing protein [Streptomyces hygroscopicus]